jgi:hypothetical protein
MAGLCVATVVTVAADLGSKVSMRAEGVLSAMVDESGRYSESARRDIVNGTRRSRCSGQHMCRGGIRNVARE